MPDESAGEDVFVGWLTFDRLGGGYVAVRKANGRHVQASTWVELTAAVVVATAADAWQESWGLRW